MISNDFIRLHGRNYMDGMKRIEHVFYLTTINLVQMFNGNIQFLINSMVSLN